MLVHLSFSFTYFILLCGKLQAKFILSHLTPGNSIVNILVDLYRVNNAAWELNLLNNLLDDNSHPKRIHNMSSFVLYDSKQYKRCYYNSYIDPKMTSHYSQEIFLILPAVPKWLATGNFYGIQSQMASCGENPDVIFLIDRDANTASFVPRPRRLVKLTSKLFVLGRGAQGTVDIHVFCYPCSPHPLRRIDHTNSNSFKLMEWELYNHNSNGMIVSIGSEQEYSRKRHTCSSLHYSDRSFPTLINCLQITLGQRRNFTHGQTHGARGHKPHTIHVIEYNKLLTTYMMNYFVLHNSPEKLSLLIYDIKVIRTTLTVISLKSSSLVESFESFLLPFDAPTWTGIIVSVLGIAAVIALTKLESVMYRFSTALFWTYACLTGQYDGTNDVLRMLPRSKIFIVTSVFFFFMIGTEFYQGSLFSSLITTSPPELPISTDELINLNLQIITTGYVYGGGGQTSTAVEMIYDSLRKSKYGTKLLTHLRRRSKFIPTRNSFMLGVQLANSQQFYFNRSIRKLEETFAILDETRQAESSTTHGFSSEIVFCAGRVKVWGRKSYYVSYYDPVRWNKLMVSRPSRYSWIC
ncbi:hypothetical protein Fcan01_25914 [Folsomia candida]|uniref:Uncharacterized protein n=1 Tax=Folsomia candida TaxID=158441 RepID=A0A226D166_FOLCA|nr:hypothetical protein Fcan01_25914 [Folsomia candida]